jgi:flagellar basal body L-ring protein FlgH
MKAQRCTAIARPDQTNIGHGLLALIVTLSIGACTVAPASIVQQPVTAKPAARAKALASSGSVYQAQSYKALFEDRRARAIGDILTINISENTSAGKSGEGSSSKDSAMDATSTSKLVKFNLSSASSMSNQDKAVAA